MNDQAIALSPMEAYELEPQDRRRPLTFTRIATIVLSVTVIAAALYQIRKLDFANVAALIPTDPLFWMLFAISYLTGPFSEWIIFRKLWGVGPRALGALVRKLIYNEMLLGYLGELYFYTWARQQLKLKTTPFGAVKDVAVLSAMAGNVMTLALLVVCLPIVRLLPLQDHASAIGWSLAFVIGTSLAIMLWRKSIFSLTRKELGFVMLVHVARICATTFFSALLWHMVLPNTPVVWWLLLATIRLLISRLPFVPNKDLVFAGIAVIALGQQVQLAELMTMMAALILATHVIVGILIGGFDLVHGTKRNNETPAS